MGLLLGIERIRPTGTGSSKSVWKHSSLLSFFGSVVVFVLFYNVGLLARVRRGEYERRCGWVGGGVFHGSAKIHGPSVAVA
jgi:hypothetical protein